MLIKITNKGIKHIEDNNFHLKIIQKFHHDTNKLFLDNLIVDIKAIFFLHKTHKSLSHFFVSFFV